MSNKISICCLCPLLFVACSSISSGRQDVDDLASACGIKGSVIKVYIGGSIKDPAIDWILKKNDRDSFSSSCVSLAAADEFDANYYSQYFQEKVAKKHLTRIINYCEEI
jgi:hypothetical protein